MKRGCYVRIEKLRATPYGLPACPLPLYFPGAWAGHLSLPVDYWLEGYLLRDVAPGDVIDLDRRVRHGLAVRGRFVSSRICSCSNAEIATVNSVYIVREIPPPPADVETAPKRACPDAAAASSIRRETPDLRRISDT
jgi:hypothetical protein